MDDMGSLDEEKITSSNEGKPLAIFPFDKIGKWVRYGKPWRWGRLAKNVGQRKVQDKPDDGGFFLYILVNCIF